jgi:hypothetical protein
VLARSGPLSEALLAFGCLCNSKNPVILQDFMAPDYWTCFCLATCPVRPPAEHWRCVFRPQVV